MNELLPLLVARYLKATIGPQSAIKCYYCGHSGVNIPNANNIKIGWPPVLFLWLNVLMNDKQNVKCGVNEVLELESGSKVYHLTSSIVHQPNHFLAVSRIKDNFYNLDNFNIEEVKSP